MFKKNLQPIATDEDILAVVDSTDAVSFWAISSNKDARIRFIGMPKHYSMPLLALNTQFTGCQMSAMSRRLLEQYGADVSPAIVVEELVPTPCEIDLSQTFPSESKSSPSKAGLFANTLPPTSSGISKPLVDLKAQSLLAEILSLVEEVYPPDDGYVAKDRTTMLAKLKPYQDRQANLTIADRAELRKLQLALEEIQAATASLDF